ncbi:serine protease [Salipiger sp. 1_MG-2023]|uniref:S1C family serine protease n=1 Tax=Salipiger sp. 1_MG-2023 TaxID=3062665 RepID=UPI0026E2CBA8|nr:serine protease [Salipiger sp. 1_MG-2023]MDO6587136.1 serine protease [Salipiger sp. 1_MG-2023]MDO6587143.1 serine protease [Salipiger sp. 1_MG-2023]
MIRLLRHLLLATLALTAPARVAAQNFETLFWNFDATSLTWEDKRFLQASLAFEGQYVGLLDGDWGRLSQQSMSRYSSKEFDDATQNWHLAALAFSMFERIENEGWYVRFFEPLGLSFLYPLRAVANDPPTAALVNWRHTNSSLRYSVGRQTLATVENLHEYSMRWHEFSDAPYTVRKERLLVTGAKKRDGSQLYTRSDYINGGWSTIMLSANRQDSASLQAVASSIERGEAADLRFTPGGNLDRVIEKTVLFLTDDDSEPEAQISSAEPSTGTSGSAGSGFYVSKAGHVLTNAHVVDGCATVRVDGFDATVLASSDDFDLAILVSQLPYEAEKAIAVFSAGPAKLNSDVTVVGYPYAGLLGGLNVTRGSVSSLKGLAGDTKTVQITAPVQAGNSGGPLISATGEVVGVIVSKLDSELWSEFTGDVPQNVNFAIRGEIAKLFLSQNGVDPELSLSDVRLDPVSIAERASMFTAYIECD